MPFCNFDRPRRITRCVNRISLLLSPFRGPLAGVELKNMNMQIGAEFSTFAHVPKRCYQPEGIDLEPSRNNLLPRPEICK